MGQPDAARVDIGAVLDIAGRFDAVADQLDAIARAHLWKLGFGGAVAGRAHAGRGDDVRAALLPLSDDVRMWARACAEIAAGMRGSADRYVLAEADGAARLG